MKGASNVKIHSSKRSYTDVRVPVNVHILVFFFVVVTVTYCSLVTVGVLFLFERLANMLIPCVR